MSGKEKESRKGEHDMSKDIRQTKHTPGPEGGGGMGANKWASPLPVDDLTLAFPAHVCGTLLPPFGEVPQEFHRPMHPMVREVDRLFFQGGHLPALRDDIDPVAAKRHLSAVLQSFEPSHEHKTAAAAYLLSLWTVKTKARGEA